MRRCEFITLIGGEALFVACPFAVGAQEAGRTYRPGFLLPSPRQAPAGLAFLDELRLNAFAEGENLIVIPGGFEATDDRLAERAATLINAAPDVIVSGPES